MPRTVGKSTRATSYPERCPGAPPIVAWRRHIVPAHRPTGVAYAQYKRNEVLEAVGTVRQVAAATGVSKTTVARTRRRSAPLYTFCFSAFLRFAFCVCAFCRFFQKALSQFATRFRTPISAFANPPNAFSLPNKCFRKRQTPFSVLPFCFLVPT